MQRTRGRALRRRYGRSLMGPHAISRPVGGGMFRVVIVDPHGTEIKTLAKRVPYALAKSIIQRHG